MSKIIQKGSCKVQYLYNSGFIVETESNVLIFDLCQDGRFITEELLSSKPVTVFITHNHSDHFNPLVYQWADTFPVQYIVDKGVDMPQGLKGISVDVDSQYLLDSLTVNTFGSTDRGVSFLVEVDGVTLFHSGDLNWWKWKNDSAKAQKQEELDYKAEVDKLIGKEIDLAFIPVDPRLGEFYHLAAKYFAETIKVNTIIPMHFRETILPIEELKVAWSKLNYHSKFIPLTNEGQIYYYLKQKRLGLS